MFGMALPVRLTGMVLADLAILWYDRDLVIATWRSLVSYRFTFRYKWWVYALVPVIGFLMDFILGIIFWPVKLLLTWLFIWHKW